MKTGWQIHPFESGSSSPGSMIPPIGWPNNRAALKASGGIEADSKIALE
jgi:hypothetical protein